MAEARRKMHEIDAQKKKSENKKTKKIRNLGVSDN